MNSPIRKVAVALGILLAAVFINLNIVQVVKGNQYRNHAGNQRVILTEYTNQRGEIVVQGTSIALSKKTGDEVKYLRTYPYGPVYAPVTGYFSLVYGTSALEYAENSILSGDDPDLFASNLSDLLTGRSQRGGSVTLTLNKAAQEAGYAAMKNPNGSFKRGAVVALDPTTGAILAAVSTPSYDPNALSSHDTAAISANYRKLLDDPNQPLINRAFNGLYPAGSVFKVIVSAAALANEKIKPDTVVPAPNYYWPLTGATSPACPANDSGPCVHNFDRETCDNGKTAELIYAFAKSCNTAFSYLAVQKIGGQALKAQGQKFGLDGTDLSVPLGVSNSTIGSDADLADKASLAQTAFGQRDVRITPLQAAMLSAAVANDGTLMTPYLVSQERGPSLSLISATKQKKLSQVLPADLDAELQQMMVGVVTRPEGTGSAARITDIPGVTVGGKTGTADTTDSNGKPAPPDAWFTGYAEQGGSPKIAVAVIIENGGVNGDETTGGLAAAPVAKAVMEAYLKSGGAR